jgi:hypothetical protein
VIIADGLSPRGARQDNGLPAVSGRPSSAMNDTTAMAMT